MKFAEFFRKSILKNICEGLFLHIYLSRAPTHHGLNKSFENFLQIYCKIQSNILTTTKNIILGSSYITSFPPPMIFYPFYAIRV